MNNLLRTCLLAAGLAAVFPATLTKGQTVTIREINPTHSNIGGLNATGGRINRLGRATDHIVYAASEFGGVFKSTDRGRTWTRLDAHLPTRVNDIKASPGNPNLVVATSLFDGRVSSFAGINVSRDGGATWSKPASSIPPPGFCNSSAAAEPSAFGIAFDPENVSNIVVGTNCGLARSTDGGVNWTYKNPGTGLLASSVFGVTVHHGGIIDTCGLAGHRRSTNGGTTWTGVQAGGMPLPAGTCSIVASPDEASVLFATVGTLIFESDNGGGTWNTQFVNPRLQGRVPFVVTQKRQGSRFDLWFGDVEIFSANCTTPATPSSAPRCPPSNTWTVTGKGAHSDMGDVIFSNPPPPIDEEVCLENCTNQHDSCTRECEEFLESCLDEAGEPGGRTPAQCYQAAARCNAACNRALNSCQNNCSRPREGCPVLLASDGGTYFNANAIHPACQTPHWVQSDVTTRALWLWSLSGSDVGNSHTQEMLYMGAQDDGSFTTGDAGGSTPNWTNPDCCDAFDTVSDTARVLSTVCCFPGRANRLFRRDPGMTGGGEIPNYPAGNLPQFFFPDSIAQFGLGRYAIITSSGIFATLDISTPTISWSNLGANAPTNACGIWAAGSSTNPTFFAMSGDCNGNSGATLRRYVGISTTGSWQNVPLPPGFTNIGVFAVDPNNPNRLFISALGSSGARMFRSADGGATWAADTALDILLSGYGSFVTRSVTLLYVQPTLVAFDPNNSNNLLAGGADSGIFLSQNNGTSWTTLTNNSGGASNPVIPRPHWAYFDRECSQYNIYVGTQGRGAWRLQYADPNGVSVNGCQGRCDNEFTSCRNTCNELRADCIAEGELPVAQCNIRATQCIARCNNVSNACKQRCVDCPQ